MIRDRDRRVLAAIEQQLRATDPELCDRLSRWEAPPGPVLHALERLASTGAIVGWLVALLVALLLGMPGLALLLAAVAFAAVFVRLARAELQRPDPGGHPGPPPFGLPPGRLR